MPGPVSHEDGVGLGEGVKLSKLLAKGAQWAAFALKPCAA